MANDPIHNYKVAFYYTQQVYSTMQVIYCQYWKILFSVMSKVTWNCPYPIIV